MTADVRGGEATIVIQAPRIDTHDIDPDSVTGLVSNSSASPAVRIDGRPVDPHPEQRSPRTLTTHVAPGPHRVEVMVKQRYETVVVDAEAGETIELHIAYRRDRMGGDDRLFVGSKTHVNAAMKTSSVLGDALGCGALMLLPALIGSTVAAATTHERIGLAAGSAMLAGIGAAVAIALLAGAVAGLVTRLRPGPDSASTAPSPLRLEPAPGADESPLVLPAGADPPAGRSGILLRPRARPRTLNMIGFPSRMRDPVRAHHYEFYFNEFTDWVRAPRVFLDDVELGAAWGKWWIPTGPGRHRLRVEIDHIGGHRVTGLSGEAEVEVGDEPARIDALFNFLEMVNQRTRHYPQIESRWQQIMRRTGRYDAPAEQAANEPAVEFIERT